MHRDTWAGDRRIVSRPKYRDTYRDTHHLSRPVMRLQRRNQATILTLAVVKGGIDFTDCYTDLSLNQWTEHKIVLLFSVAYIIGGHFKYINTY